MKEREKNNLFFRAETTHSQTLNDGALNNYNGVSTFTSSANVNTTLFMQSLGFSAKNTYNRYLFEESSPVSNLFLGLKYMIERDGKDKTSTYFAEVNRFGETALLENQAYLPLGFLANSELADLEFTTTGNGFDFQNRLFTAATGVTEDVWHRIGSFRIYGDGVNVFEEDGQGCCKYDSTVDKGDLTYSFTAETDGFVCVQLDLPKRNEFYVSVNGEELYKEKISLQQMLAVKDVKAGDEITLRIVCPNGESSSTTVTAAVLDADVFNQGYQVLNASTWRLTKFRSTRLEGTIDCDRDGLLYTSIPQNGNWHVFVDGQETQTVKVGNCMTAVSLTEGTHTVRFVYRNPGFELGWKISAASAGVFALWIFMTRKDRKRGKSARKPAEN